MLCLSHLYSHTRSLFSPQTSSFPPCLPVRLSRCYYLYASEFQSPTSLVNDNGYYLAPEEKILKEQECSIISSFFLPIYSWMFLEASTHRKGPQKGNVFSSLSIRTFPFWWRIFVFEFPSLFLHDCILISVRSIVFTISPVFNRSQRVCVSNFKILSSMLTLILLLFFLLIPLPFGRYSSLISLVCCVSRNLI